MRKEKWLDILKENYTLADELEDQIFSHFKKLDKLVNDVKTQDIEHWKDRNDYEGIFAMMNLDHDKKVIGYNEKKNELINPTCVN